MPDTRRTSGQLGTLETGMRGNREFDRPPLTVSAMPPATPIVRAGDVSRADSAWGLWLIVRLMSGCPSDDGSSDLAGLAAASFNSALAEEWFVGQGTSGSGSGPTLYVGNFPAFPTLANDLLRASQEVEAATATFQPSAEADGDPFGQTNANADTAYRQHLTRTLTALANLAAGLTTLSQAITAAATILAETDRGIEQAMGAAGPG
jgi:hypothetical protein